MTGFKTCALPIWGRGGWGGALNSAPASGDEQPVSALVTEAVKTWPGEVQIEQDQNAPHEAGRLTLCSGKANRVLNWEPRWSFETTIAKTIDWYRKYDAGASPISLVDADISAFEEAAA